VPENLSLLRRFLAHTLLLCDSAVDEAEAALVLSELTSNALEHGGSDLLAVRVVVAPGRLTIEVSDLTADEPRPMPDSSKAETGRGLRIVDQLATRWGWDAVDGDGKTVWATLHDPQGS
jgi:anti-sigma regulatory factor (Ser/Thr protein kinase)